MLPCVATLSDPLDGLIPATPRSQLEKAFGISTVGDLVRHYPRRYYTRGELTDLARLHEQDHVTVMARVASVRHIRNPIDLARRVMEKSRHVLLVGAGAEEFALEEHFTLVPNQYFRTAERMEQLESEQRGERVSDLVPPTSQGTVGAVACDAAGNLAAATSTGGMTNKRPGRVGDSPIIGAGTYAKNGICAVSATGHGEYFIRAVAAHHVCAAVEYRGLTLEQAAHELLHRVLRELGGDGGLIAIDGVGRIVMDFSTEGMFRGARDAAGRREIAIY